MIHDTLATPTYLHTQLDTVLLKSPFLNASGPLGWFFESHAIMDYHHLGAFVLKGLTKHKRKGNEGTRVHILPFGIINTVGLENPGVHTFLRYHYPTIKHTSNNAHTFIANINGTTKQEYEYIAQQLDKADSIQGIEINLSCPNIKNGGLHFINDHTAVKHIVQAVRNSTNKMLTVKIPYIENKTTLKHLVKIIQDNGINSISAINTISTEAPTFSHIQDIHAITNTIKGGLSGAYITQYALDTIRTIRSYSTIPIIGSGGITHFSDVLQFFKAGAHAVAIGTAALYDHHIFTDMFNTALTCMKQNHLTSIEELYSFAKAIL